VNESLDALNRLGAVLYRAGRFQEAAQRLAEAEAVFQ
jgi:Flp pilus assembly protein TadD